MGVWKGAGVEMPLPGLVVVGGGAVVLDEVVTAAARVVVLAVVEGRGSEKASMHHDVSGTQAAHELLSEGFHRNH
jgi:hypothetical protein